jgi:type II secretory pathway predicted ATPase ExeA
MNKLLSCYGLVRPPFSKDIHPSEMLQMPHLQEALLALKAAVEEQTSAVMKGDSGCGKTCVWRVLEEELSQGRYRVHYLSNSAVNRRDFYRQLSVALGLEPHSSFAALYNGTGGQLQTEWPANFCLGLAAWACRWQLIYFCIIGVCKIPILSLKSIVK